MSDAPTTFGEMLDDVAELLKRNGRLEFKRDALRALADAGMTDAAKIIAALHREDMPR